MKTEMCTNKRCGRYSWEVGCSGGRCPYCGRVTQAWVESLKLLSVSVLITLIIVALSFLL